jgi:hypothetical protein
VVLPAQGDALEISGRGQDDIDRDGFV